MHSFEEILVLIFNFNIRLLSTLIPSQRDGPAVKNGFESALKYDSAGKK
jgi:hypothetical protein